MNPNRGRHVSYIRLWYLSATACRLFLITPNDADDDYKLLHSNSLTTTTEATTGGAMTAGMGENLETSKTTCTATWEQQRSAARMVHLCLK